MNNLFGILKIILPLFIAWGLISSCKPVEEEFQAHEVSVFNSIEVSLKTTPKIKYVEGLGWDKCYSGLDPLTPVESGLAIPAELDVSSGHMLCVPDALALEFKITGTYNNGQKRELTNAEVRDWVKWKLKEESTSDTGVKAVQQPEHGIPPKVVRVYNPARYESAGDASGDASADVELRAVFMPNQLNAHQTLTSSYIPVVLLEPALERIEIVVDTDATTDNFCDIVKESNIVAVEGCLKQFKAIAHLDSDITGDFTKKVVWSTKLSDIDDYEYVAKFLENIAKISDEVLQKDWAEELENIDQTKVIKFVKVDNNLYYDSTDDVTPSKQNKKGLLLAKSAGQLKISATYPGNQIYNRDSTPDVGYYIDKSTTMNVDSPKVMNMILRVNADSKGNPEFNNDSTGDSPLYRSAILYDPTTDIYIMTVNTNVNLVAYGVYENKSERVVTQLAKWTATELDGTQDITSDHIAIGDVPGNIEATKDTLTPVTITAEKDSFKKTMKIRVGKELLLGVSFQPKKTDTGEYHIYEASRGATIDNIRVNGNYSNSRLQPGRISDERVETRYAKLNFFADWKEVLVEASDDATSELLYIKKRYDSFAGYETTSDKKFPIYFKAAEYDGTSDLKVTVKNVCVDEKCDVTHDVTYDWRVEIRDTAPPVDVKIIPNPSDYSTDDIWIAEKSIQLEAMGIWQHYMPLTKRLEHDKVNWSWILTDGLHPSCDEWIEWSLDEKCFCDISGVGKKPCVIGNGLLVSHQNIEIKATSALSGRRYDKIIFTVGGTVKETALKGIRIIPENITVDGGDIAILGAEGVFDNGKSYFLRNECLKWEVTSNSELIHNDDLSGILHPSADDTFVVLRTDQETAVGDDVELLVTSEPSCGEGGDIGWQKIKPDISNTANLTIQPLPEVGFSDSTHSPDESTSTHTITVSIKDGFNAQKEITVFYAVENIDASADDYEITSDKVVIPMGSSSRSFDFNVTDDDLDENDEKVRIRILKDSLVNARLGSATETTEVTIRDNDPAPLISLLNISSTVNEAVGTVYIGLKLTNSGGDATTSGRDITVNYSVDNSGLVGATCDNNDYTLEGDSATIPKGFDRYFIQFDVSNDDLYETTEKLRVNVDATTDSYTLIIEDNDKLDIKKLEQASGNECGNDYKACALFGFSKEYSFSPVVNVSDSGGPILEYTITGKPSWDSSWDSCGYNCSTEGKLSGQIDATNNYENIFICVEDVTEGTARGRDCLAPFTIIAE